MLGWQLCLALLLLNGINCQDNPGVSKTVVPFGMHNGLFIFCNQIVHTGDKVLCGCCPPTIPYPSNYKIDICNTCVDDTTTTQTDPTTTTIQSTVATTTPIPTTTQDDTTVTTTASPMTTTLSSTTSKPTDFTTTGTIETSTTLPTTGTTQMSSTSTTLHADTTTPKLSTTTVSTPTTSLDQVTSTPGASTSTPGGKTTTVMDKTLATTTTKKTDPTTDQTSKPTKVSSSTSDSTTQSSSTGNIGSTLTTPTTPTTLTTDPKVSTASTVTTSSPSTPSSKTPGTSTVSSTLTYSVSTHSTPTSVKQTAQTSKTSTATTTVPSSTMQPSTTDTSSDTTTHIESSTIKTTQSTTQTSSVPKSYTSTTISEASTSTTDGQPTFSLDGTTTQTVEDSSLTSTSTTAASSQGTTTETETPTSTNFEMSSTQLSSTRTEEISTSQVMSSTTQRTYKASTTVNSTSATDFSSIEIETSTTTNYQPSTTSTDNVMETTTAAAEHITTSFKGTDDPTTTATSHVTTMTENMTSEGTTMLPTTTDLPTEATNVPTSQLTYKTDSTTETILHSTSLSTELVTEKSSTTEVDVSTETPTTRPPWCDYPCPYGYIEAERGCFIMVPEEFRQNFMSAFMWCRSEDRRDLSDQDDIMTSNMIETLKYMLRLQGIRSDIIYLNGHADKLMRKDKKAGLIHLEEISIWDNLPTDYVGLSTDIVNVTGICRMPKFCETPVCDLNAIYKMLPEKVEDVENKTIVMGSGIRLKCLYPSRDFLNVRCIDPGEFMPSPTLLSCTIPADIKYEPPEKEVTGNMRVRETCSDCYEDGTANCTAEGDGYVCNCKEGWNKFTCYKSVDLCPPQYCGPNGNCVTQLEDFFCNCTTGWIGDKCDVNIKKITWGGNRTLRIISSNTIASGLLGVSSGIQISLKVLSKVITDKDPEDPQEAYQAFRSTCLTMGNLAIALFQHPDLLSSEPISCRWFFFFVHICYSLAFVFMLDEVLNVCTTIHGLHRNNWVHDNKMKKRWWLDIPARIQFPFVLVFALLWYVASQGWSKIPATWTCFGVFKRETSNIWYPLVLFNFVSIVLCFGFAENARRTLSHRIQFWTANMHLVDVTNPYIRESIEKVRRNVPYCFLLPPFMFLNWLFLCWAADQQTDTVKFVSLLFSGCYTVLSMLQTLETSTGIYEYVVYYGHLYLPNCISNRILQDLTPMTWLSKNEIVAKKKKTVFNGLDASSPYHPASICYITLEHEHLMLKRMTREYLDHRVTHYSKQDEATLSVYFNELRLRHVYEKNVPLEDLHLELILETWITDTKRIDQLTIPPKAKKQKETWRTRIRAKNRIPPKENTNICRMRFLKTCMDYHLKTLNPTLEYPITGAMQRTDFRTFSPACPCVLRSQVEDLQRTWLPIIDIYIEQDWSLREVYKEVQQAEGHKAREPRYECKKEDVEEDHWLNELRPGFIGPRSYPLVYLPALGTYLELDYYQRFADLEWARLVKHSEYLGACYDFGR